MTQIVLSYDDDAMEWTNHTPGADLLQIDFSDVVPFGDPAGVMEKIQLVQDPTLKAELVAKFMDLADNNDVDLDDYDIPGIESIKHQQAVEMLRAAGYQVYGGPST